MNSRHLQVVLALALATILAAAGTARADGDAAELRNRVSTWLDANYLNKYPDSHAKVRQQVADDLQEGRNFELTFGPGVMQSGKPTRFYVFGGQFGSVELSMAQVRKALEGPDRVSYVKGDKSTEVRARFGGFADVIVTKLTLADTTAVDPTKPIAGKLSYLGSGRKLPLGAQVRLTCHHGGKTITRFSAMIPTLEPLKPLNPAPGLPEDPTLSLSFPPLADDSTKATPFDGPMLVYIDLCSFGDEPVDPKLKILSDSFAQLIDVTAGPKAAATDRSMPADGNPESLVGTQWRFTGSDTTVTFLKGGSLLWNGKEAQGHWKQDGQTVTINVNDFTLFKLTLKGDQMTGQWERLKGDDKGTTSASSLTKVKG